MITLANNVPEIHIHLDNGLYLYNSESASGKTRLCKELKKLQQRDERVSGYTYEDYQLGIPIITVLNPDKYDVVALDRYHMYNGVGAEHIVECAKQCIVLIDCKSDLKINTMYEYCFIEMRKDAIEVMGY